MTTTYKWLISALDTAPSLNGISDVIQVIHWRYNATDGTDTAEIYGSLGVADMVSDTFIEFSQLKETDVTAWLEEKLDVETYQQNLQNQLDSLKAPAIISKAAPWLTTVVEEQPTVSEEVEQDDTTSDELSPE